MISLEVAARESVASINETVYMPPIDARLIGPKDKIDTPVDDRGVIDVDELIRQVRGTIDPSYEWPAVSNIHHFYWPESSYIPVPDPGVETGAYLFRDLPVHKGLIPKVFHNWLHEVTVPPPVPDPEVMRYRSEAWRVARLLFESVNQATLREKGLKRAQYIRENPDTLRKAFDGADIIAEEVIQDVLERNFKGAQEHLDQLRQIPSEFQDFDPNTSLNALISEIGQIATRKSRLLVITAI